MPRKIHIDKPATTPAADEPKTYSVPELAKRWRMHRHTITTAIRAGRLQVFKVGERHYRIREAEVLRYEQERQAVAS